MAVGTVEHDGHGASHGNDRRQGISGRPERMRVRRGKGSDKYQCGWPTQMAGVTVM